MPRERIAPLSANPEENRPHVEVLWSAEVDYVQVGVARREAVAIDISEEAHHQAQGLVQALTELGLDKAKAENEVGRLVDQIREDLSVEGNGLFSDHDRQSINHLVKVLRRARNAAFGADE